MKFKNKYIYLLCVVILIGIILYFQIENQKWIKHENFDENKKYLEGVDVIYWINLERSVDRRDNMMNLFKNKQFENIPNIRINAVDGKTLNLEDYFITKPTIELTNNQYACLLSHLIAIREFEQTNYNIALIMEDDASMDYKEFWNDNIKEIVAQAPSDWEIIKLAIIPYNCNQNEYVHQTDKFSHGWTASTLAYLINKKGAKKISEHWKNNKYDIELDIIPVADMYIYTVLKTYEYIFPYFTYPDNNDSDLHSYTKPEQDIVDPCKRVVYDSMKRIF